MQDIVNRESEFMKHMISDLISKLLKSKKDISIDFQLDEFHAENSRGTISVHINMNAKMSNKDLGKILNKHVWLNNIILGIVNLKPMHNIIEKLLKKYVDIKINVLNCRNEACGVDICLNADAETTEKQLKKMLVDYALL